MNAATDTLRVLDADGRAFNVAVLLPGTPEHKGRLDEALIEVRLDNGTLAGSVYARDFWNVVAKRQGWLLDHGNRWALDAVALEMAARFVRTVTL